MRLNSLNNSQSKLSSFRWGVSSSDDFEHDHTTNRIIGANSNNNNTEQDEEEMIEAMNFGSSEERFQQQDPTRFHYPEEQQSRGPRVRHHHTRLIEEELHEGFPSTTTSKSKDETFVHGTNTIHQSSSSVLQSLKQFERIALRNIGMKHEDDDDDDGLNLDPQFNSNRKTNKRREGKNFDPTSHSVSDEDDHRRRLLDASHIIVDDEEDAHSRLSLASVSTSQTNTYTDVDSVIDPIHPHIKHKHYYPKRHKATREEKIAYSKKVGRTLFTIFLVILMTSLTIIDVIVSPKNTWVTRLSIFVCMVIFWRFLYEYLFEIIFEWILEYLIKDD